MSPRSKREYLETVYLRYKQAARSEKSSILDEFCVTYQCHRKHAIRLLRGFKRFTKPKPRKRGKLSVYLNEAILAPLKTIWLTANLPCSKRLKAMLPLWLPKYAERFGKLSENVLQFLSYSFSKSFEFIIHLILELFQECNVNLPVLFFAVYSNSPERI